MLRSHPRVRGAAIFGILALCAACGNQSELRTSNQVGEVDGSTETSTVPGRSIVSTREAEAASLAGYFEAIGATDLAIAAKRGQLLQNCMAARGFQFEPNPVPEDPSRADIHYWEYGPASAADATNGYHHAEGDPVIEHPQKDDSSEFQEALWGDGSGERVIINSVLSGQELARLDTPGGCEAVALQEIFGSVGNYVQFVTALQQLNEFDNIGRQTLLQSAEFLALNSAWASCMIGKGISEFTSPVAAATFDWGDKPTTSELQTAAADVACKQEVDYTSRANSQLTAIENQLLLGHEDLVAAFDALLAQVVTD